jgi:hypothetical protein
MLQTQSPLTTIPSNQCGEFVSQELQLRSEETWPAAFSPSLGMFITAFAFFLHPIGRTGCILPSFEVSVQLMVLREWSWSCRRVCIPNEESNVLSDWLVRS